MPRLVCCACRERVVREGDGGTVYMGLCRPCFSARVRAERAAAEPAPRVYVPRPGPTDLELVEMARDHELGCLVCVNGGGSAFGLHRCQRRALGLGW